MNRDVSASHIVVSGDSDLAIGPPCGPDEDCTVTELDTSAMNVSLISGAMRALGTASYMSNAARKRGRERDSGLNSAAVNAAPASAVLDEADQPVQKSRKNKHRGYWLREVVVKNFYGIVITINNGHEE